MRLDRRHALVVLASAFLCTAPAAAQVEKSVTAKEVSRLERFLRS